MMMMYIRILKPDENIQHLMSFFFCFDEKNRRAFPSIMLVLNFGFNGIIFSFSLLSVIVNPPSRRILAGVYPFLSSAVCFGFNKQADII